MTYGKNQRALLTFLEKHPDRWHRIKRRKAINAARGLKVDHGKVDCVRIEGTWCVRYSIPQMLRSQA